MKRRFVNLNDSVLFGVRNCQPSINGYLFSNQERIRRIKETNGFRRVASGLGLHCLSGYHILDVEH